MDIRRLGMAAIMGVVVVTVGLGTVFLAAGCGTSSPAAQPPTVASVTPVRGPMAGGTTVTVTGTVFEVGGTQVMFGAAAATNVSVASATQLTCNAPPGTGTVDVKVTTAGGSATLAGAYTYNPAPTLTDITPALGLSTGGTPVTLTGTGFMANAAGTNAVTIAGNPATNVMVVSDTSLTCDAPAGAVGPADVAVSNTNGSATLAGGFLNVAPNTFTPEIEPNDTAITATPLPAIYVGEGNVDTIGDEDYWSFDATMGQLLSIEIFAVRCDQATWAGNSNSATLILYDTDGTTRLRTREQTANFGTPGWVHQQGDLGIACFEVPATGTYYLRVAQDDPLAAGGGYGLRVNRLTQTVDQTEVEAPGVSGANDTAGTAEAITPGRLKGFHVDNELDFYSFTVTGPTVVRAEITAHRNGIWESDDSWVDPYLRVYDTDGTTLLFTIDDAFFFDPALEFKLTTAGTYYLVVDEFAPQTGDGTYYLEFATSDPGATTEMEPNDTSATAQMIAYGDTVSAAKAPGDEDWYAFNGTAGDAIRLQQFDQINLQGALGILMPEIIAPDGTTVIPQGPSNALRVTTAILLETGTHFIRYMDVATTNYCLRLERFGAAAYETEANDTPGTANALDANGRAAGVIDPAADVDVFSFTAEADQMVLLQVVCGAANGAFSLQGWGSTLSALVTVRDAGGTALTAAQITDPANPNIEANGVVNWLPSIELCFGPLAAGTYYVEIADENGTGMPSHTYWIERR